MIYKPSFLQRKKEADCQVVWYGWKQRKAEAAVRLIPEIERPRGSRLKTKTSRMSLCLRERAAKRNIHNEISKRKQYPKRNIKTNATLFSMPCRPQKDQKVPSVCFVLEIGSLQEPITPLFFLKKTDFLVWQIKSQFWSTTLFVDISRWPAR